MNNEIDLLDELEREERDERLTTGGGGAGAALGVLLTLVIGCGLVFSAYKLGQRKTVDEPPLIAANELPIKIVPDDIGGTAIPNTDNFANAMIDGQRPEISMESASDRVLAEGDLPGRNIDQSALTADARETMREVTQLGDLAMKASLDGEPSLTTDGPPDRTDEQMMVAGAEVAPAARPSLDELVAQAAADDSETRGPMLGDAGPALALDTQEGTGTGIADVLAGGDPDAVPEPLAANMRLPMRKPNLSSASMAPRQTAEASPTPQLAPETREVTQQIRQVQPAVVSRLTPNPPPARPNQLINPVPQVPGPSGVQRVRVAPQPRGDAQVQLGAFPSPNEVRGRWAAMKARNPDLLGPLGLQVLPVQASNGQRLFRMRVGPLRDTVQAAQLCQALAGRGVDCFVPQR